MCGYLFILVWGGALGWGRCACRREGSQSSDNDNENADVDYEKEEDDDDEEDEDEEENDTRRRRRARNNPSDSLLHDPNFTAGGRYRPMRQAREKKIEVGPAFHMLIYVL